MSKEEIIDQIIESLTELKADEDIEITNFSSKPEIESWEMVDGRGYDFLSYQFTIQFKQPKEFRIIGGIKKYVNNKGEKMKFNKELAKKLYDLYFKQSKEDKELLEKILDAFEDVAERHFKAINLIKKAIAIKDITGNATLNLNELLEILGDKEK